MRGDYRCLAANKKKLPSLMNKESSSLHSFCAFHEESPPTAANGSHWALRAPHRWCLSTTVSLPERGYTDQYRDVNGLRPGLPGFIPPNISTDGKSVEDVSRELHRGHS